MRSYEEIGAELNRHREEVIKPLLDTFNSDLEALTEKARAIGYDDALLWVLKFKDNG